jgi:hypothetical protein
MGERYAALAARRRLKTALAAVYPYAVPFNLTEIMRTAITWETTAQRTSFRSGSQESKAKICKMQVRKELSDDGKDDGKYVTFTGGVSSRRRPTRIVAKKMARPKVRSAALTQAPVAMDAWGPCAHADMTALGLYTTLI